MVQATAKAASAAKNFKGLDQMAANDEYVNSEGLNVKRKEHPTEKKRQAAGKENQEKRIPCSSQQSHITGNRSRDSSQNTYMLDSVARVISDTSVTVPTSSQIDRRVQMTPTRQKPKSVNIKDIYESDDESVNSREESFPSTMNRNYPDRNTSKGMPSSAKKSKDPNRFMADLDARLKHDAHPENDIESQNTVQQSRQETQTWSSSQHGEQQPSNLFQKMDWLRDMTPHKIQQSLSQIIPGIQQTVPSTSNIEHQPLCRVDSKDDFGDDKERVHKVQSSALIGDNENEELMRIRQKMNAGVIATAMDLLEKNRHYLLIVVTFILSTWFYFGSRNNATEDEV